MGPANASTSGEPTRLRTQARVCGPNSVVPMEEPIRNSDTSAFRGARNVPSSRRSNRTSVWSPAVRFARIASRGLVGVNPSEGNGTVVVRPNLYAWRPSAPAADVRIETPCTMRVRILAAAALHLVAGEPTNLPADEFLHRFERCTGQGRRVQLGEQEIGRPSLVKSAKRNPLLVVQPESDEDELPHRSARMAGRLFSFPPKTLNRVLRNRGPCARGASSFRGSAGKKSDVVSWIWASCTSISASFGKETVSSSRRRHGWTSTFERNSGNSARDSWPSGATKTSLRCRSRSADRFPVPST